MGNRFNLRVGSWETALCTGLLAMALLACKKGSEETGETGGAGSSPTPNSQPPNEAGQPPPADSAVAEPAQAVASCVVEQEKVWSQGVTERTGITPTALPNRKYALGTAISDRPVVLTVQPNGEASFTRIEQTSGSKVGARMDTKLGRRDMQRVTPFVKDGVTLAYADYRDRMNDGSRRIACGPAENDQALLVFDGIPIQDQVAKRAEAKAAEAKAGEAKAAEVSEPAAPSAAGDGGADAGAPAKGRLQLKRNSLSGIARLPKLELKKPPEEAPKRLQEVRDCRSFVDQRRQEVWGLASELVAEPSGDKYQWEMRFYVKTPGGASQRIHTTKLGDNPKVLHTLEAPVAARVGDDTFLTARYQGALLAWQLDSAYRLKGSMKRYSGGYPSLVRFVEDGEVTRLFTSQKNAQELWHIGQMRLAGGFAGSLGKLNLQGETQSEPGFARVGELRFLSYHGGDRRKAQLFIQAVDGDLNPKGAPFQVSKPEHEVYESVLLPLDNGKLHLTSLRRPAANRAVELVSQVLSCKVPS